MDTIALLLPSTVETSVAASMGCKNGLDAGAHEEFHVENSSVEFPEWNCGRLAARGRMENWIGSLWAWRLCAGRKCPALTSQGGYWTFCLIWYCLSLR